MLACVGGDFYLHLGEPALASPQPVLEVSQACQRRGILVAGVHLPRQGANVRIPGGEVALHGLAFQLKFGDALIGLHVSLGERLGILQLFLATLTLAVLPVAAALAKRRRLEGDLRATLEQVDDGRRRLADAEAHFRLLADSATDVILKVDADDVIQYVSPSARRYGYALDDLIGASGFSLVHPDDDNKKEAIL